MKLSFLLLLIFISIFSFGQFPVTVKVGSPTTGYEIKGLLVIDTAVQFTKNYPDTATANFGLIKLIPGSVIRVADTTLYMRNQTVNKWVLLSKDGSGGGGTVTGANNGLTNNAGTIQMGGSVIQYTPITLSSNPVKFIHNGINAAGQTDSNGVVLANFTIAATILDSNTSPAIFHSVNGRRTSSGGASQNVTFRTDVVGLSGGGAASGLYRIMSSRNGAAYSPVFSITAVGLIPDPLNLNGARLGYTTSSGSLFFGQAALVANVSGLDNLAIGTGSQQLNTSGSNNTSLGHLTLSNNRLGNFNVAIGYQALSNVDSNYNTAVGYNSQLSSTKGYFNTSVGAQSLFTNTTGNQNSAFGMNALAFNTTGSKNTAVGAGAMEGTTIGSFNTGIGEDVLLHNTTGSNNIAMGWLAGSLNDIGSNNVSLGWSSARTVQFQNKSVFIGESSGYLTATGAVLQEDSCYNCIAIGSNSYTTLNNQMRLGNDSLTSTYLYGVTHNSLASLTVLVLDTATGDKNHVYHIPMSSIVGATPTFQQVLTAGSTLTASGSNSVDVNNGSLDFTGANSLQFGTTGAGSILNIAQSGPNQNIRLQDSILIQPYLGKINIDSLRGLHNANDSMVVWQPSSGAFGMRPIPSGSSGITIGTTTITSGTNTRVLFDDGGVVGEDAGFTYIKASDGLTVLGTINVGSAANPANISTQNATGDLPASAWYSSGGTGNVSIVPIAGGGVAKLTLGYFNGTAWTSALEYSSTTGATPTNILINKGGAGKVGIGTASPTTELTLNGQFKVFAPQAGDIDSIATWKDGKLSATLSSSLTGLPYIALTGTSTATGTITLDLNGVGNFTISNGDLEVAAGNVSFSGQGNNQLGNTADATYFRASGSNGDDKVFIMTPATSGATNGDALTLVDNATGEVGYAPNLAFNLKKEGTEILAKNGIIYSKDRIGNTTAISPHYFPLGKDKSEDMAWSYYSRNEKIGKEIFIDMLLLARKVEQLTGEKLVYINNIK